MADWAGQRTLKVNPSDKNFTKSRNTEMAMSHGRPDFATTKMNENAPTKSNGKIVNQPDIEGLKKFYARQHSPTKRISLSHKGTNEQNYSSMTRFKKGLEANKI